MPRLKLTIAYVGTAYNGWQTQARKNATPLPTVQTFIENAVAHILGDRVHVHGAGRTDSGVHADAQVAHLDIPDTRASLNWQQALNTLLPRDIRIVDAHLVPSSFHAQHDAVRKTYEYPGFRDAIRPQSSIPSSAPAARWMSDAWTRPVVIFWAGTTSPVSKMPERIYAPQFVPCLPFPVPLQDRFLRIVWSWHGSLKRTASSSRWSATLWDFSSPWDNTVSNLPKYSPFSNPGIAGQLLRLLQLAV